MSIPEAIGGTRRAVIIGIDEYEDKEITPLKGASNDAKEIYERLNNPFIGNFDIPKEHYLRNNEATCKAIRKAISDIFWQTKPSDLALFYFSGHGFVDSYQEGYIASYDISVKEPWVCGINMKDIKQIFTDSHAFNKCVIMMIDCCFSGILTKGGGSDPTIKALLNQGEGIITLSSSEAENVSREISYKHKNGTEHNHGAFTACLIDGLDGQASDDSSGIISLEKLRNYVDGRFLPGGDMQGKQKPHFYAAEGYAIETIRMAVSSQKYNEDIQGNIDRAMNLFIKGSIRFIFSSNYNIQCSEE